MLREFKVEGGIDDNGQGIASDHWHQGAGACEIEVDIETGKLTVTKYAGTSWAGRVVNPVRARAQDQGNIIYGLGPTLFEEMVFDGGQVTNANLSDYLIPSILDIPRELMTKAVEAPDAEMSGIGEMTLPCVSPAIANALYDAIGIRVRDLPLTPERLWRAIQASGREAA
jgi:CO/xanthine dehydrogenase Mo-binding subunit